MISVLVLPVQQRPHPPPVYPMPPNYISSSRSRAFLFSPNRKASLHYCLKKLQLVTKKPFCSHKGGGFPQGFSALAEEDEEEDLVWDSGDIGTTLCFYMFILHVPLSFGGLSTVAYVLHKPSLDPQTEALSLLAVQILEIIGSLVLLKCKAKPQFNFVNLFKANKISEGRNWFFASVVAVGCLFLIVFLTSWFADSVFGPKEAVHNTKLKEILQSSDISLGACALVYCITTPFLEEVVYRGFLLRSMSSTMEWPKALVVSSVIFSAAHFSVENFPQLFIVGYALGCSYCWTGPFGTQDTLDIEEQDICSVAFGIFALWNVMGYKMRRGSLSFTFTTITRQ